MEKYDKNELDISRLNNKVTSLEISLNNLKRENEKLKEVNNHKIDVAVKAVENLMSMFEADLEKSEYMQKTIGNLLESVARLEEQNQTINISLDENFEQNANYGIMWSAISEIQETIAKDKGEPVSFVFTRRVL